MSPVAVRILHAEPGPHAGPLERALIAARAELAERHRHGFEAAGATDVRVVGGPPDRLTFGARLRQVAGEALDTGAGGLVVLGSGALPLATQRDRRAFVATAEGSGPGGARQQRLLGGHRRDLRVGPPARPARRAGPPRRQRAAALAGGSGGRPRLGARSLAAGHRPRLAARPAPARPIRRRRPAQGGRHPAGGSRGPAAGHPGDPRQPAGRACAGGQDVGPHAAGAGARHGLPGPGARRGARPAGIEHARVWDGRRGPGRSHRLPRSSGRRR